MKSLKHIGAANYVPISVEKKKNYKEIEKELEPKSTKSSNEGTEKNTVL
jgi:hypothetical protein